MHGLQYVSQDMQHHHMPKNRGIISPNFGYIPGMQSMHCHTCRFCTRYAYFADRAKYAYPLTRTCHAMTLHSDSMPYSCTPYGFYYSPTHAMPCLLTTKKDMPPLRTPGDMSTTILPATRMLRAADHPLRCPCIYKSKNSDPR